MQSPRSTFPPTGPTSSFRHDSRDEATVASVTEEITRLQAELSAQQSLRQRLQAQADAEEQQRKEADQAEAAAALREVELEIAEAQKRASELRSRVVTK
jgi:chromosome segregation ATPase